MLKKLSKRTQDSLNQALATVGDMALKRRARRVVEELELKDRDQVLEVGCGNGYYLSLLNRLGFKITLSGIDNDKAALIDAERFIANNKVKLILGDAVKLPFKNNSFDKVICSEVIEHVQDEEKVLQEIHRVLKKEGIMVLSTCNINYPFFWDPINWTLQHFFHTYIKKGFWAGIWNQHLRMYEQKEVERLVKEAKFSISLSETLTGWCLPFNHYVINFTARILDRLFYKGKLPFELAQGIIKFKNGRQPFLVKTIFSLVNLYDSLNDIIPLNSGVSIFIKTRKI